ncbi:MAG TPA: carboxypeptidase-like regulatory domain-containing protein [Candidatus Acidoferrales bacterium]
MSRAQAQFVLRFTLTIIATAALLALAPGRAAAQTKTQTTTPTTSSAPAASIWGNVTDNHGSPLGGASVTLLNEDTKVSTGGSTDGTGQYHFEHLTPGNYNLTFTGTGTVPKQHHVRIKPGTKKVEVNERLKPPPEPDSK